MTLVAAGCGDPSSPGSGDSDVDAVDASTDPTLDGAGDAGDDAAVDADPDAGDAGDAADEALAAWCGPAWDDVRVRVDDTLAELTLDEKAAVMHGQLPLPIDGTWQTFGVERLDIPPMHMLDGPRGLSRFSGRTGTAYPVAMARGATWDANLETEVGRMIGAELRLAGADTLLAPTVNVLRHPRWGRAQETYGEDPHHIGVLGAAFVRGAQDHVMAVVKHYAANSIEDTRFEVDVQVDERTLHEVYLPHFRRIVQDAEVAGVMSAYNRVNGAWSSESAPLLRDTLRGEWGFHGFVVSDWIQGTHDTVPAIEAGLDIEMPYGAVYGPALVEAVESGQVDEALVDAAVTRILRTRWCFDARTRAPDIETIESDAALNLAEEVAARGMVLLENRDDALPLGDAGVIAVVGPLADAENTGDRGSSHVNSTDVVTPLEGLTARFGDRVVHVPGALDDDASREALAGADVVVAVIGYTEDEEGEGQIAAGDREALTLPDDDLAVLRAAAAVHDRVVAVVVTGSAFTIADERDATEALVVAWYAGARGGDALAALLAGDRDFTGRLPVVFAAADADLPTFDNTSLTVTYDGLHGYRHLAANETAPLYPFGHGRSYATLAWSSAAIARDGSDVVATVTVTNEGTLDAVETVQVYASGPTGGVSLAPLDLRGFAQVTLAPGASDTVEVRVPIDDLAHRDVATHGWQVEPGGWTFALARDTDRVEHSVTLQLDGGPVRGPAP